MMKTKPCLLVFLLALLGSVAVHGQTGLSGIVSQTFWNRLEDRQFDLNFRRAGAEAMGMGGAYVAIANTPIAALWNPAGLTQRSRPEGMVSGSFNLNSQEVTIQRFAGMKVVSDIEPLLYPSFASAIYPIRLGTRQLVAGFTYDRVIPMSQRSTDRYFVYPTGSTDYTEILKGGIHAFTPSVAFELIPQLSIGASYFFLVGSSDYKLEIKSPFATQFVFFSFKDEESYSGSYATLGLFAKPINWLSFGASAIPPHKLTVKEKKEEFYEIIEFTGTTVKDTTVVTPAEALTEFQLDLPFFYTIGVAVRPHSRLLLAFDYEARPWSEADLTKNNGVKGSANLLDSHSLHVGGQYTAPTPWADFSLRLGYYTNPSPYKDRYFHGNYLGKQIKGEVFTFGAGVARKFWSFHIGVERGTREFEYWLTDGDYYNDRISSTQEQFNEITFSASYRLK